MTKPKGFSRQVGLRLKPEEYQEICDVAAEGGFTPSAFMRHAILKEVKNKKRRKRL